jgi:c-di-GMP-binding flagellar brake protein YcgR
LKTLSLGAILPQHHQTSEGETPVAQNDSVFQNRREFFRIKFNSPVSFKSYAVSQADREKAAAEETKATTQNISQSGILFQTEQAPPQLSSILWMNMDIRTLKICQEIESRALVFNNGLLGRVVRVEEDTKNNTAYDVGVCFLTQDQKNSREVQKILSDITQASS